MKSIALLGNPNSGKSTLFNALTGSTQFVGNWPGVTVEKKEGSTSLGDKKEKVKVVDLPGIYSLSPYSNEEIISRDFLLKEHPDAVIDIVDASNLERNLYLTTQALELGVPIVIALNMMDIVKKKGEVISSAELSKQLGCPVVEISAINNKGLKELKEAVKKVLENGADIEHKFTYKDDVKTAIEDIKGFYNNSTGKVINDFDAVKVLTDEREIVADKEIPDALWDKAAEIAKKIEEKYEDDIDSVIAEQRYTWISSIIGKVILKKRKEKLSISDKIDKVLTNRILALPIFFAIIYAIYFVCLNPKGLGKTLVGYTFTFVINVMTWTSTSLTNLGVVDWLVSLISDGIIFGVGIVLAFIPYLMILYVFLGILEECGYMARVSFIMDRLFRRFGLSGKSFVPMLLGTGCSVQAIASTRTIENISDRRMTIFLTPFMPCATKMPTILLIIGLMTNSAWVAPLVYLVAILFIIIGGVFLKHTILKGEPAPFVMELPEYKLPRIKNICHFVWDKTVSFFRKVSTIILISTVVIWFLKYFSFSMTAVPIEQSMLASIGRFLAPIFKPLGFGSWQLVAAMITGYVAKDNVLSTLGIIFGKDISALGLAGGPVSMLLPNVASGVSFLLFFILSSPCFASIGAMRTELGSAKLTAKAVAFQMGTAYIVSLIAYQVIHLFV